MRLEAMRRCQRIVYVALALMMVALPCAALFADDHEWPWPHNVDPGGTPEFVLGDVTVATPDILGPSIDAKEVVEPQLTALLTMGDVESSPSEVVAVSTQPTLGIDSWTR